MEKKHLSQPWFDLVRQGAKRFEGRINSGFWGQVSPGKRFIFYNEQESFVVEVKSTKKFQSFQTAIEWVGVERVLPGLDLTVEEAVNQVYYEFYSKQMETHYGVVIIEVEVVV